MTPCAFPSNGLKAKGTGKVEGIDEALCFHSKELAGDVLRRRSVGPFVLSEQQYAAGMTLPQHVHQQALLTFVIEGTMRDNYDGQVNVCRPGALRFLPAGELHANEFETSVRCLHVSIGRDVMDSLERRSLLPGKAAEIRGLSATWLANRLYAEFSRADQASAIALEGVVLEILAEIARLQVKPDPALAPRWLRHATEIVESRFLERLSLAEIASEVGVHYVHLSRQFHKYNRCTIGELIRKRRIQYASHLLAHSQTPLAEIALICGFSDQSHLSFLFKRYMGLSPSKFRALAGVRPQTV
ncbi:MAG TPA: AraC family transcriptional regulator [Bryobacteraceae bacterium]|nr:AraC family transcriptional regulator [Bryobacteraceae bacterium]